MNVMKKKTVKLIQGNIKNVTKQTLVSFALTKNKDFVINKL